MALIVRVYVNARKIIGAWAVRVKGRPGEMCTYQTENGAITEHHYDKGGAILASKILKKHAEADGGPKSGRHKHKTKGVPEENK